MANKVNLTSKLVLTLSTYEAVYMRFVTATASSYGHLQLCNYEQVVVDVDLIYHLQSKSHILFLLGSF